MESMSMRPAVEEVAAGMAARYLWDAASILRTIGNTFCKECLCISSIYNIYGRPIRNTTDEHQHRLFRFTSTLS
jgi:hypothetical protein